VGGSASNPEEWVPRGKNLGLFVIVTVDSGLDRFVTIPFVTVWRRGKFSARGAS
jgi:hypothetical protein